MALPAPDGRMVEFDKKRFEEISELVELTVKEAERLDDAGTLYFYPGEPIADNLGVLLQYKPYGLPSAANCLFQGQIQFDKTVGYRLIENSSSESGPRFEVLHYGIRFYRHCPEYGLRFEQKSTE